MKKYDVAAIIWPSYTGDEKRARIFWPEGGSLIPLRMLHPSNSGMPNFFTILPTIKLTSITEKKT